MLNVMCFEGISLNVFLKIVTFYYLHYLSSYVILSPHVLTSLFLFHSQAVFTHYAKWSW